MSTPDLAIPHIAAGQNEKEVTADHTFDRPDETITGKLTVDFAAGDVTLTASQCRRHVAFAAIGVAAGRELLPPAIRRLFVVDNTAAAAALVRQDSSAITVPAGAVQLLHTTGTTGGLVAAAQAGSAAPSRHDRPSSSPSPPASPAATIRCTRPLRTGSTSR